MLLKRREEGRAPAGFPQTNIGEVAEVAAEEKGEPHVWISYFSNHPLITLGGGYNLVTGRTHR